MDVHQDDPSCYTYTTVAFHARLDGRTYPAPCPMETQQMEAAYKALQRRGRSTAEGVTFEIHAAEFLVRDAVEAAKIWNDAVGRTVFTVRKETP
jgi:hypothetical protein